MALSDAWFWNKPTVDFTEGAILELDSETLVDALKTRIESLLGKIRYDDALKTAESISQKVGHVLVDLYGEIIDIDHMVEVLAALKDSAGRAFQTGTILGFQASIQEKVRGIFEALSKDPPPVTVPSTSEPSDPPADISQDHPSLLLSLPEGIRKGNTSPNRTEKNKQPKIQVALETVSDDREAILEGEKEALEQARKGWYEWAFQTYMRWVIRYNLLTREEEIALAARNRKGDERARHDMIVCNLRLVVKIAFDYKGYGMDVDDLISEGNIGLMKAVERFDPDKGAKLSTYAAWWIKQSIKRALSNQGRDIRLPVHVVEKISKIRRIAGLMSEDLGREPTEDELSEELGIEPKKLSALLLLSRSPLSLDEGVGEDGETTRGEIIGDDNAPTAFELASNRDMLGQVDGLLHVLDERELEIITARFGLGGQKPRTLEDVWGEFGVTRERIRQLQKIALKKLRRELQKKEEPLPDAVRSMRTVKKKMNGRSKKKTIDAWKEKTIRNGSLTPEFLKKAASQIAWLTGRENITLQHKKPASPIVVAGWWNLPRASWNTPLPSVPKKNWQTRLTGQVIRDTGVRFMIRAGYLGQASSIPCDIPDLANDLEIPDADIRATLSDMGIALRQQDV